MAVVRWQQGYCTAHGRYQCATCLRQEARERAADDFGAFEWRADGRYTRGTALRIFRRESDARRWADKQSGNVVVRPVTRE